MFIISSKTTPNEVAVNTSNREYAMEVGREYLDTDYVSCYSTTIDHVKAHGIKIIY